MPEDRSFNDGDLESGSSILTVTPKQTADPARPDLTNFDCIADDTFSFNENSRRVVQTNKFGRPTAKFGVPELREGTCTVQLPSGRRLFRGDTFVADSDADAADGITWIVEGADHPYTKDGYRKQTVTFSERLNTP